MDLLKFVTAQLLLKWNQEFHINLVLNFKDYAYISIVTLVNMLYSYRY